ncbi:BatD family protein [Pseudomaricurvus hydrocarbonicus]
MLAFTLFFTSMVQAQGQLSSRVDRTQLSLEETFKLTVRYNEQVMFGEPDFSGLEQNFDILSQQRGNQYRSINGKAESWTQWSLVLAPKKEGKLLIPSFEYEGSYSDAIEISVEKPSGTTGIDSEKPVFIETVISKNKAFVQEQLIYTIRLFTSVDLSGLDRGDFAVPDALVKQVAENQYQKNINGRPYGVVETSYAIFPQKSGVLTIPPVLWTVAVQNNQGYRYDPFLSRGGQRLRLRSEGDTIDVLPKPGNYTAAQWLPASQIELSQSWSQEPNNFKVGEPITRTISIHAKGLMASQLPPLSIQDIRGVKYYPDQPQADETVSAAGINTVKTESYAIVPSQPGTITLPAVTLTWWDTVNNRIQEASLPVQTIQVAESRAATSPNPASGAQQDPSQQYAAEDAAQPSPLAPASFSGSLQQRGLWFYTTVLLAFSTLFFAMLWRTARKTSTATASTPAAATDTQATEKQAYRKLKQALQGAEPQTIRTALLAWARVYENAPNLSSLHQLGDIWPPLAASLNQLEASLYGQGSSRFDAQPLQQAIIDIRRHGVARDKAQTDSGLPPLYG